MITKKYEAEGSVKHIRSPLWIIMKCVLRRWSRLWDEYGKQLLEERFLSQYGPLIFSAFHEPSLCLIGQYNTYVHTRRNNRVAVDRGGLREIRLRRIFPG